MTVEQREKLQREWDEKMALGQYRTNSGIVARVNVLTEELAEAYFPSLGPMSSGNAWITVYLSAIYKA